MAATRAAARTSLSRQLFRLAAELRRRRQFEITQEGVLADAGLRPVAKAVLMFVDQRGPSSQREISDALGIAASDLVLVLDQLEAEGLTERRRDASDRRRNLVEATADGATAAGQLAEAAARADASVLARLTAAEQDQLLHLLNRAVGQD